MLVKPRKMSGRSPSAGYVGKPSSAKLTLDDVPWNRKRWMVSTRSLGSSRGATSSRKGRRGASAAATGAGRHVAPRATGAPRRREAPPRVERADTGLGAVFGPVLQRDPDGPAVLGDDVADRRFE